MTQRLASVSAGILLFLCGTYLVWAAQQTRTLSLAGRKGELAVVDLNGRYYVEVEALAHLSNGSLTIDGSRMVLTIGGPSVHEDASISRKNEPGPALSKDFIKAGIEEMAAIREWRSTLGNAIERGFPVTADWLDHYSNRAQQNLRLATLNVSTDADRSALQLLSNLYSNMKHLSDGFLKLKKSMTYIRPDSLDNNPLDKKILECARSLAAMASSGQFVDEGSCH